jgi:hypothetical protein
MLSRSQAFAARKVISIISSYTCVVTEKWNLFDQEVVQGEVTII